MATAKKPSFTLRNAQFEKLIGTGEWELHDVPQKDWHLFPDWMVKDAVGMVISGTGRGITEEKVLNGLSAVGGIDWLRHETKPKGNEPEGNAYHFVICKVSDDEYKVYGTYPKGMKVPHHFDASQLDLYWSTTNKE